MKYIFILGNNPELSQAEIEAVLPQLKIVKNSSQYLVAETPKFDCQEMMARLGGTVKIGIFLGDKPEVGPILGSAGSQTGQGRFNFGLSFYGQKPSSWGMKIKKTLKEQGIGCRLVTSREPALSSVIVTKEKCHDFLIGPDFFGLTCAVQDFEEYSNRDFGRPKSDALSGMLPPKLAKMMINLAQVSEDKIILDPFCGSGTILSEALALGYHNLIGSDLSTKAVNDSQENCEWLIKNFQLKNYSLKFFNLDARKLSLKIKEQTMDAIVTEPYLGPPIKGNESPERIKKNLAELEVLYLETFQELKKILRSKGKLVIVIPEWHLGAKIFQLNIFDGIAKLGYERKDKNNLFYRREDQKVWRQIIVLEKK
ncbi:MAG: DNA methyltransferase [Patescibacteria group bacterium]